MWFTVFYTIPGQLEAVPLKIPAYAPDKQTAMNQIERLYPECVPYDAVAPEPFVKRSRV